MIEILLPGLIMGLVGSAHCAGMCGPLVISLACARGGTGHAWMSPLIYQFGRLAAYLFIGAGFAALGTAFSLAGWQQALSMVAGCLILAALFVGPRWTGGRWLTQWIQWVKSSFAAKIHSPGWRATMGLGFINGFLPCGLVYVAGASAAAYGHAVAAMAFMLAFGLGTFPMMLALQVSGNRIKPAFRFKLQKLIPVVWGIMGVLLIIRGLDLGIPYLSPHFSGLNGVCPHCH